MIEQVKDEWMNPVVGALVWKAAIVFRRSMVARMLKSHEGVIDGQNYY